MDEENTNKIRELKKKFIVDEKSFEEESISKMLEKIIEVCEIGKNGCVRFKTKMASDKEKIKYILVARFLANKLDESIEKKVSLIDIEKMLDKGRSDKGVSGRISELKKERVIDADSEGYSVKPYKIKEILRMENEKK